MPDQTAPTPTLRRAMVEGLYLRHGALVQRTCRAILGDHHAAEDASQDVFAKLFSHPDPAGIRDPRRWLLEVTRNHCIDRLRAAARRPTAPIDCGRVAACDDAEARSVAREHLRWLLSLLTPGQRSVVVRQAVLDEPLDTVASRLGLSYGATAQLLYRARLVLARAGNTGDAALVLVGARITALGRRLHSLALRVAAGAGPQAGRAPLDAVFAIPFAALLITLLGGGHAVRPAQGTPAAAAPVRIGASQPVAARIVPTASASRVVAVTVTAPGAPVTGHTPPPPAAVPQPPNRLTIVSHALDRPHCTSTVPGVPVQECTAGGPPTFTVTVGAGLVPPGLP